MAWWCMHINVRALLHFYEWEFDRQSPPLIKHCLLFWVSFARIEKGMKYIYIYMYIFFFIKETFSALWDEKGCFIIYKHVILLLIIKTHSFIVLETCRTFTQYVAPLGHITDKTHRQLSFDHVLHLDMQVLYFNLHALSSLNCCCGSELWLLQLWETGERISGEEVRDKH